MKKKGYFWPAVLLAILFISYGSHGKLWGNFRARPIVAFWGEDGSLLNLNILTRKSIEAAHGGALVVNKPIGLAVSSSASTKRIAQILPDENDVGSIIGAYASGPRRIICNLRDVNNRRRKYHLGIWDISTGEFRVIRGVGSAAHSTVSSINSNGTRVFASRYDNEGIILHNLQNSSSAHLFADFYIYHTPIFSHDGSRFALLTTGRPHLNDGSGKFLIIQSLADNKISKTALHGKSHGGTLLFTPSGETIVGVLYGDSDVKELNIWKSADGTLLVSRDLPFYIDSGDWPPILAPDGTSILIFEKIRGGGYKQHSFPITGSTEVH